MRSTDKLDALEALLRPLGGAAVAFSGGVDSTLLLAVALKTFGGRTLAVICRSPTHPSNELEAAVRLADHLGAACEVVDTRELEEERFASNPPDRCYHCKQILFEAIRGRAARAGLDVVVEGSNADDMDDYRPGRRAIEELGVRSPLLEVGLTKAEIRELSRGLGLPTWDKPAMACLASRIPYGEPITSKRLARIGAAEAALGDLGIHQLRVRDHGSVARIEVPPERVADLAREPLRERVTAALRRAGYTYVTLDLTGYRTGSLNELLPGSR